jgi:hypothetical protein
MEIPADAGAGDAPSPQTAGHPVQGCACQGSGHGVCGALDVHSAGTASMADAMTKLATTACSATA